MSVPFGTTGVIFLQTTDIALSFSLLVINNVQLLIWMNLQVRKLTLKINSWLQLGYYECISMAPMLVL